MKPKDTKQKSLDQKYEENIRNQLYETLGLNNKKAMKQVLDKQWEILQPKLQCFRLVIDENPIVDNSTTIVEFVHSLFESSFSKIKN